MEDKEGDNNVPRKSVGSRKASKAGMRKGSVFEKALDLDDVLVAELGQFGLFQMRNLLLMSALFLMHAFISEYIFTAAAIPHRCRIAECGEVDKSDMFEPEWIYNAIPSNNNNDLQSCSRYVSLGNGTPDYCPANLFSASTTDCNGDFVYARDNSVVYDFNLGCQEWLRALIGTMSNVGTLLVLPITGFVSDRYGRKIALIVSVFNFALLGMIRAFSVNYIMYLIMNLLQTTLGAGIFSAAYIYSTEFVGPKYRVVAGTLCLTMFSLGQVLLGGLAWLIQPWRTLILVMYCPCFIVVSYYWIIEESVRWLLSKEKYSEAKVVLEKVAKMNRKEISEKYLNALMKPPAPTAVEEEDKPSLFSVIFRSRVLLRRVCTTPIWWVTTTFVYYGLSINSTGLSDTMYLNYILTSLIEVPGFFTAMFVMSKFGRKLTLSVGYFLSAGCNIGFAFISPDLTTVRLLIYLLGKFAIAGVFSSLYMYTSELYPTQYRHTLLAFSSMIGRIGSITAPLTPVLMEYWAGIPSVMFGAMSVLSGVLVLTQPETLGTKLPDTLAEAEALGTPESKRVDV